MNLNDKLTRQAIISEYVLGTMHYQTRRRFEQMQLADPVLKRETDEFALRLNRLAAYVKPVKPRARVWRAIESRLDRTQKRGTSGFWKFATTMATAAALVLAILLAIPKSQEPTIISLVSNEQAQNAWILSSTGQSGFLKVRALAEQNKPLNKDFELWLIPDSQSTPVSLGLLSPKGEIQIKLGKNILQQIRQAAALAVSLEPKGGSPTGAPTGPVLYQGKIISL